MDATQIVRARDLKPGMGRYDTTLGRDVRVERVEVDGDDAMVWWSNDGREAFMFPYNADAQFEVDATS